MHRGGSHTQSFGIDSSGIQETRQLSVADRALMRKYQTLEAVRDNFQQAGIYKQESTSSVSRVDGHLLKPSLSLYDRALLQKYPDSNSSSSSFSEMQPLPSSASILVSSPPVVYPIESAKKRKRSIGKENSKKANIGADVRDDPRHDLDQAGSPCGFQSKVAEPLVPLACFGFPSTLISGLPDFAFLYLTLVKDQAVPMGYMQEFSSLEVPARRAAKRFQISAASISKSMAATALSGLRHEASHRATEIGSIADLIKTKEVSDEMAARSLRWTHRAQRRRTCGARAMGSVACQFTSFNRYTNGKIDS